MLPRETSGGPYSPSRSTAPPPNRMTTRNQVSTVYEEICSGCVEATRERDGLFFADFGSATVRFLLSGVRGFEAERDLRVRVGVGSATASLVTSADFEAARDRLRAGFASEPRPTSTGVGAAGDDTSGVACAVDLRPNPSALAIVERRSE